MAKLKIRVDVKDGQTVSKFAASKLNKVVFKNDADDVLTVTIENATANDSPICNGDGDYVDRFMVDGGDQEAFFVCGNWQEFKYTAQVEGAAPEDPIVIIESKSLVPVDPNPIVIIERSLAGSEALWVIAGLVIGLLAGAMLTRKPRG